MFQDSIYPELLSFTDATLLAPIFLLIILYLPTLIYVCFISMKFYGWNNWISGIFDDPVLFIFPMVTCMSFYGRKEENRRKTKLEHDTRKLHEERKENFMEFSNNEDSIANERTEDTDRNQLNLEVLESRVVEVESVGEEGGILKFKLFVVVLVCLYK